jgi:hypothetical protein
MIASSGLQVFATQSVSAERSTSAAARSAVCCMLLLGSSFRQAL